MRAFKNSRGRTVVCKCVDALRMFAIDYNWYPVWTWLCSWYRIDITLSSYIWKWKTVFVFLFCKGFTELLERVKLLQISSSLSEDEVRILKFVAISKLKVDARRYKDIEDCLELFDELENNGELTHIYVGELLKRIRRFDLVDILARPGTGKRTFHLLWNSTTVQRYICALDHSVMSQLTSVVPLAFPNNDVILSRGFIASSRRPIRFRSTVYSRCAPTTILLLIYKFKFRNFIKVPLWSNSWYPFFILSYSIGLSKISC